MVEIFILLIESNTVSVFSHEFRKRKVAEYCEVCSLSNKYGRVGRFYFCRLSIASTPKTIHSLKLHYTAIRMKYDWFKVWNNVINIEVISCFDLYFKLPNWIKYLSKFFYRSSFCLFGFSRTDYFFNHMYMWGWVSILLCLHDISDLFKADKLLRERLIFNACI